MADARREAGPKSLEEIERIGRYVIARDALGLEIREATNGFLRIVERLLGRSIRAQVRIGAPGGRGGGHPLADITGVVVRARPLRGAEAKSRVLARPWSAHVQTRAGAEIAPSFAFATEGDAERFANTVRRSLAALRVPR